MNYKKYLAGMAVLVIAFSAGRFSSPKHVEIREVEKVIYKDRIVKDVNRQVRVETKETKLPDGTTITETIKDRKSESRTDTQSEGESYTDKQSKTTNQSDWSVGLYSIHGLQVMSATVDRRILGGVFAGVYLRTDIPNHNIEYGLGLRVEF